MIKYIKAIGQGTLAALITLVVLFCVIELGQLIYNKFGQIPLAIYGALVIFGTLYTIIFWPEKDDIHDPSPL